MKLLKKILYVLVALLSFSIIKVNAATLKVNISSSSNKIVVGNTVTYTVTISSSELLGSIRYNFSYDTDKLTLVSGTLNAAPYFDGVKKSATYTFKFRAKKSGTATVKFNIYEAIDWNLNNFSYNATTSKSTTIITQSQLEASYSKNNNLSSLKVDNYPITPEFNKNTTEYSLTLENDVREINITGTKEDNKATVTGLGKHELAEGMNKINIVVTAQNGSSKTYILNVEVKELAPILVKVDNKELSIVRKKELLTLPNTNYQETTIKINEEEIPAFKNDVTNTTLVGLKDEEGKIELYTYDNGKYTLYKEFAFDSIIVTENTINETLEGYTKTTININDKEIEALKENDNDNYYIINATNINTGKSNLYQYNKNENTLQIFNKNILTKISNLEEKNQNYIFIILSLGGLLFVTYLFILISSIKKKRNVKNKNDKEKKNEINDEKEEKRDISKEKEKKKK